MKDFHIGRYCVRIFRRPWSAPQRPYFSRRYTVASFGAGPLGVQIMHTITQAEIDAINARIPEAARGRR